MPPPDPSVVRIDGPWRHLQVHANGIRFHVVEGEGSEPDERNADGSSNAERPLVILLHGFASFWYSWRHQLRDLRGARVVAVDLRGYDGWTLAGDTAGLVRALGHHSAVLVGHADGGLVCWATAMLHPRAVRGIALISSPHPMALRSSTLTDRDQRAALLPAMLRNQVPWWPEHVLTRQNGAAVEQLVRSRAGAAWPASEDFAQTATHLRTAIQIPSAAHSALEYQRWAARSQVRSEGRRFMRAMKQRTTVPILHLHGTADPYVLDDPVRRTQRYAPQTRFVSVTGAGHFAHEEQPSSVTSELSTFLHQLSG